MDTGFFAVALEGRRGLPFGAVFPTAGKGENMPAWRCHELLASPSQC